MQAVRAAIMEMTRYVKCLEEALEMLATDGHRTTFKQSILNPARENLARAALAKKMLSNLFEDLKENMND
jgi:hypothetical protein